MTWKKPEVVTQRAEFVQAMLAQSASLSAVCQTFGISRPTGYRWLQRYHAEGQGGLADRPSGPPDAPPGARRQRWAAALITWRQKHPEWGARKLQARLQREEPGARLPSVRTIARLLQAAGLIGRRRQHCLRGPALSGPARTVARRCHVVWTVDFKGHFRTGDGEYCRP